MTPYVGLLNNIVLLLALGLVYGCIVRRWRKASGPHQVTTGLLFGVFTTLNMLVPVELVPGVIFDGRSVILSLVAAFGGPVAAAIAATIATIVRLSIGGAGAWTGVGVIITSTALGVLFSFWRCRKPCNPGVGPLLLLGLVVHVAMLAWMLSLPGTLSGEVLRRLSLPILLFYPAGTVLLGMVLFDLEERQGLHDEIRRCGIAKVTSEKKGERKFRTLFETMTQGIVYQDTEGHITLANPSAERILGATMDQMQGRTSMDPSWRAIREDGTDFPGEEHPAMVALRTGRVLQNVLMGVQSPLWQEHHWIRVSAVPQFVRGRETPSQVVTVFDDVTEEIRTRRALERRTELFNSIFDGIPVMLTVYDSELRFLHLNREIYRTTGWSPEEAARVDLMEEAYPDPEYRESVLQFMRSRSTDWREFTLRTRDGSERDTSWTNISLADGTHIGVGLDITSEKSAEAERKRLQDQVLHLQKMEAVGRLAGGIAHDFNNLLTAIFGYIDFGLDEIETEESVREAFEELHKLSDSAAALTRQLLAFSRKQDIQLRPVRLGRLIDKTMKLLTRVLGEDVELACSATEVDATILGDSAQIEQVLVNLAVNARDAMPNGGRLSISVREERVEHETVERHPSLTPGQYVVLEVADTGSGMDKETAQQAFDPFFTTKEYGKGTGLGLPTVFGIVTQHGGAIELTSKEGKGGTSHTDWLRSGARFTPEVFHDLWDDVAARLSEQPSPEVHSSGFIPIAPRQSHRTAST